MSQSFAHWDFLRGELSVASISLPSQMKFAPKLSKDKHGKKPSQASKESVRGRLLFSASWFSETRTCSRLEMSACNGLSQIFTDDRLTLRRLGNHGARSAPWPAGTFGRRWQRAAWLKDNHAEVLSGDQNRPRSPSRKAPRSLEIPRLGTDIHMDWRGHSRG